MSDYPIVRLAVVTSERSPNPPILMEAGLPVVGLEAENLGRAKSIVLAVDRSRSMRGRALADASEAARTFVGAKPPDDRIAVVAFGSDALELTPFSTATIDADTALRTLSLDDRRGTALYDAVVLAARSVAAEPLPSRVIILLTDGRDVSSAAALDDAIEAARAAGASVYPIAIEGPEFSPAPLRALASATGGSYYGAVSSAALTEIYAAVSKELARTWRLEYVTSARPGERVRLEASVAGEGTASTRLAVPTSLGPPPIAHPDPSGLFPKSFYQERWGPMALAGIVGAIVLLACGFGFASPKGAWLRGRLAPHVDEARRARARAHTGGRERLAVVAALFRATERALGRLRQWRRLELLLQRADLPLRTVEFVYLTTGLSVVLGFLAAAARLSTLAIALAIGVGALAPLAVVWLRARKRLKAFEAQLPDLLITLAASLKAGHSFRQGIQTVVDEGQEPASKELKRVLTEARLGRPMDDALGEMAARLGSKNFDFVITAVTIQRQVGGSLASLFDMAADTVRSRQQFQRKIKGLTAMGRLSAYVLIALPFFVAAGITLLNSIYMDPLYHSSIGHKLIFAGLVMMAFGSLVLKKIVTFKG